MAGEMKDTMALERLGEPRGRMSGPSSESARWLFAFCAENERMRSRANSGSRSTS